MPVAQINALATKFRIPYSAGDELIVRLVKEGREHGQGVGYLDDGTMVVVEEASAMIGSQIEARVRNVIQTTTGRMIFASVEATDRARAALSGSVAPGSARVCHASSVTEGDVRAAAIVLAAGAGRRIGAERPKAFLPIGDRPMLAVAAAGGRRITGDRGARRRGPGRLRGRGARVPRGPSGPLGGRDRREHAAGVGPCGARRPR